MSVTFMFWQWIWFSYMTFSFNEQWNTGNNEFPVPATQYNPLDEPSPLGLRLRKSPSLLDLIQMRLSQSSSSTVSANHNLTDKKDFKGTTASTSNDKLKAANFDKLKATNFPALLLRIGNWEVYATLYLLFFFLYI